MKLKRRSFIQSVSALFGTAAVVPQAATAVIPQNHDHASDTIRYATYPYLNTTPVIDPARITKADPSR